MDPNIFTMPVDFNFLVFQKEEDSCSRSYGVLYKVEKKTFVITFSKPKSEDDSVENLTQLWKVQVYPACDSGVVKSWTPLISSYEKEANESVAILYVKRHLENLVMAEY